MAENEKQKTKNSVICVRIDSAWGDRSGDQNYLSNARTSMRRIVEVVCSNI